MDIDVMIIAAHPDDAEIAMGGTILSLTKAGKRVVILDLSNGEPTPTGTVEKRMKEASAAADMLGVFKRVTLDLPNREIMDSIENRKKVAAVIREYRPSILFAPYWEDAHPDHKEAYKLAEASRFYAKLSKSDMPFEPFYPRKFFHYFSTHIRVKLMPSFIYNITGLFEEKMKVLNCYKSQFVENEKNKAVFDKITTINKTWGLQIGVAYGEPFACLEDIAIHSPEGLLSA